MFSLYYFFSQGYEGDMSSQATLQSSRRFGGSLSSLDSARSDPFGGKSPRMARRQLEEIPEGPSKYQFRTVSMNQGDTQIWMSYSD